MYVKRHNYKKLKLKLIFILSLFITIFNSTFSYSKQSKNDNFDSENAIRLMKNYDVNCYFLDLNIENNSTYIYGNTTISFTNLIDSLTLFCFELNSMLEIDSIILERSNLKFNRYGNYCLVAIPTALCDRHLFNVKIHYHGECSFLDGYVIGSGFSTKQSGKWGNSVTWSLSEPFYAFQWFPCKQDLTDKADSSKIYITTSDTNKVASNGLLEGIEYLNNNKIKYKWKSNYPIVYYLISVAVSDYQEYITNVTINSNNKIDSILFVNYLYNHSELLNSSKDKIDSIGLVMSYFNELLGEYPFKKEKYGMAMAPLSGGMEHQTMTTVSNLDDFLLNVHELAHQWFGNNITCKTWNDIFINEGFSSYMEIVSLEHFKGSSEKRKRLSQLKELVLKFPESKIAINDISSYAKIFDKINTYYKPTLVLNILRNKVGDSVFFQSLKELNSLYKGTNLTINDAKRCFEKYSKLNLTPFFDQWVFGFGYPIINVKIKNNIFYKRLLIRQKSSSEKNIIYEFPIEILFKTEKGEFSRIYFVTKKQHKFKIKIHSKKLSFIIDPNSNLLFLDQINLTKKTK